MLIITNNESVNNFFILFYFIDGKVIVAMLIECVQKVTNTLTVRYLIVNRKAGRIRPLIDDEKTKFMTGFIKLNYEGELIQSKIKDFVNTIVNVLSNNENLLKVK